MADEDLVKLEPAASPAGFTDEDIYEDAGDLEFNGDPNYHMLYLARVPKYIWDTWSKLDDDAEIQIGTIRKSTERGADGVEKHKLRMLLRSDLAQHQNVPKEYELQITSEVVQNTFVFTEQDLPGFKSRSKIKFDPATANMPARLNRARVEKQGEKKPSDRKKFEPFYRRAIPKKTILAGKIAHEVNCVAVMNEEAEHIIAQRTIDAMKPKAGTIFIQGDASGMANGFVQPGTIQAQEAFQNFIKGTSVVKGKANVQETKTARMPQNELLDRIFSCFRKYNYWSMKALRAELQQPEVYLRETLEKVADMPKSGRFAMHWTLKPEFKNATHEGADKGSAPTTMPGTEGVDESDVGDLDVEDDEEDIKMEDVLPS